MLAALKDVGRVDGPALDDSAARSSGGAATASDERGGSIDCAKASRSRASAQASRRTPPSTSGVIRLIFILATMFSGGTLALVYLVLMFVMPIAQTDAEIAEARGGIPRVCSPLGLTSLFVLVKTRTNGNHRTR